MTLQRTLRLPMERGQEKDCRSTCALLFVREDATPGTTLHRAVGGDDDGERDTCEDGDNAGEHDEVELLVWGVLISQMECEESEAGQRDGAQKALFGISRPRAGEEGEDR